jgi:hypothetical protein
MTSSSRTVGPSHLPISPRFNRCCWRLATGYAPDILHSPATWEFEVLIKEIGVHRHALRTTRNPSAVLNPDGFDQILPQGSDFPALSPLGLGLANLFSCTDSAVASRQLDEVGTGDNGGYSPHPVVYPNSIFFLGRSCPSMPCPHSQSVGIKTPQSP